MMGRRMPCISQYDVYDMVTNVDEGTKKGHFHMFCFKGLRKKDDTYYI